MKPVCRFIFLLFFIFSIKFSFAQITHRRCYSHEYLQERIKENPWLLDNLESVEHHVQAYNSHPHLQTRGSVITIPVVVHIVYRTAHPEENITDAQVMSQLDVLNKDYRRLNPDRLKTPSVFKPFAVDCGIEFQLAKRDNKGKSTNGIIRYQKNRTSTWGKDDEVKMPLTGGIEPWNASKYLNIWVCAIGNGVLGYSTAPGMNPMLDGVVIDYRYFGTTGTVVEPFNLGRTTTHEVGHWLNLQHLWGDNDCGDDKVADTPTQYGPNYVCPTFPQLSCGNTTSGDMFMNYMDYTDDVCMNMFTKGQKNRIDALFSATGSRASLPLSDGLIPVSTCLSATNILAKNITEKSATIYWEGDTSLINALMYRKQNLGDWIVLPNAKKQSIALENLQHDTTYEFKIRTYCIDSQLVDSKIDTFKTLQDLTICKDLFEPNNTFSNAKTIHTNRTIMVQLSSPTDIDFFQYANTKEGKNVDIRLTNLPADYDLYLYDRFKQLIGYSTKTNLRDENVRLQNLPISIYYIRVISRKGEHSDDCYHLKITTLDSIDTRQQPNGFDKIVGPMVISPNPVSDVLSIDFEANLDANTEGGLAVLTLYDLLGRSVTQKTFGIKRIMNHLEWDVTEIPDGFYLLAFYFNNQVFNQKILISK
jgi:hypothetical protein